MSSSKKKTLSKSKKNDLFVRLKQLNKNTKDIEKLHKLDIRGTSKYVKYPNIYWEYNEKPTDARGKENKSLITLGEFNTPYLPKTTINKFIKCGCLRFDNYYEFINLGTKAYTIGEVMEKFMIFTIN